MEHWHIIAIMLGGWVINLFILSHFLDKFERLWEEIQKVKKDEL